MSISWPARAATNSVSAVRSRRLLSSVTLCVALLRPAGAQLFAPNDAGIRMGHVHLNVRSVAAHKKFWVEQIGARAVRIGSVEGVEIPGLLLLFRQQEPAGTVAGSVIDYEEGLQGAGFKVTNPNVVAACGCGSSFRVAEEEQVSAV